MSGTLSRLVLALSLFAAAPALYIVSYIVIERRWVRDDADALMVANLLVGTLLVAGWVGLWRREVLWTPQRISKTILSVVLAVLPGWGVYHIILSVKSHLDEVGTLLGGLVWAVSWLASTGIIWRDTTQERSQRYQQFGGHFVTCPTCGYNLTGLREAKCPECGSVYTLDQLLAAQLQKRTDADLQDAGPKPG